MTLADLFQQSQIYQQSERGSIGIDAHMRFETFGANMNQDAGRAYMRLDFPVDPVAFTDITKPMGRNLLSTVIYTAPFFGAEEDIHFWWHNFSAGEQDVQVWYHGNGKLSLSGPAPDGTPAFFAFMPLEWDANFSIDKDVFDNKGGRDFLSRFSGQGSSSDFGNGLTIRIDKVDFLDY